MIGVMMVCGVYWLVIDIVFDVRFGMMCILLCFKVFSDIWVVCFVEIYRKFGISFLISDVLEVFGSLV